MVKNSRLDFRLMLWTFRLRDIFKPPKEVLTESGIKSGMRVLDYGCGPGSYTIAAAQIVGGSGKVYALDVNPLAVQQVRKVAMKKGLKNIETILSDCATGLEDESIDTVLLFDTFHDLERPEAVLAELYRVLRPDGVLSFNDHHLKEEHEIISRVTNGGLFKVLNIGKRVYNFIKAPWGQRNDFRRDT